MVHQEDILQWLSQINISSKTSDNHIQSTHYGSNHLDDVSSLDLGSSPPSIGKGCLENLQNGPQTTSSLDLGSPPPCLGGANFPGHMPTANEMSLSLGSPPPILKADSLKYGQRKTQLSPGQQPNCIEDTEISENSLNFGTPPQQLRSNILALIDSPSSDLISQNVNDVSRKDKEKVTKPFRKEKETRKTSGKQKNSSKKERREAKELLRQSSSISESDGSYKPTESDDAQINLFDNCSDVQVTLLYQNSPYSEDRILGDPWFWGRVWEKLSKLNSASPIDLAILDFYLLSDWLENRRINSSSSFYYIDMRTVQKLHQGVVKPSTKELFWREGEAVRKKPVFLLLEHASLYNRPHFLILNYEIKKALLLGTAESTEKFNNPQWFQETWTSVADFFGWDFPSSTSASIVVQNWISGQIEFGPKIASLFSLALTGQWGWKDDGWGNPISPNFLCSRLMLQRIFTKTLHRCCNYGQTWKLLHKELQDTWVKPMQRTVEELNIGFLNFSWVKYSLVRLSNYLGSCLTCEVHSEMCDQFVALEDEDMSVTEGSQTEAHSVYKTSIDVIDPLPLRVSSSNSSEGSGIQERKPGPLDLEDEENFDLWNATDKFNASYDDYGSAPIPVENPIPTDKNIWVFGRDGVQILPDCWTFWKDQGFRLHPTSFRTLPLDDVPVEMVAERKFIPFPKTRRRPRPLISKDKNEECLVLSARSFIDEAGTLPDTEESRRVFLLGKERQEILSKDKEKYLVLDLEKDKEDVPNDAIDISVDLDSLIWVTSNSNFKVRNFQLRLTPVIEAKAGFSTHNFVYVNLVCPPGDEEELRNPQLRTCMDVQLSRIPHLLLGFCGEGERRINFYVFFPRMIRKNEKNRRYSTLLPLPVQELWLDNVVIPSCNQVFRKFPGFSEYIPPSLAELQMRSGDKRQKHMLICEPVTDCLMEMLVFMIKKDLELLSCFGSFFIVADGRGMKLATKQCVPQHGLDGSSSADFDLVQERFPDLHWPQMLDREKGELYLDMGISFHSRQEVPLVGLWRLPSLKKSFDAIGAKVGVVHHLSTLAFYGGIKAEMTLKQKKEAHLISRISYCLAFELVRNPGCAQYICGEKEAIQRSKKFLEACQNWMDLFQSGTTRSFGVRDEIRGLAGTIIGYLPKAVDEARASLTSDPILWVKSSTFFTLVERRFKELALLHERCFNARLPNYRFMSLLILYLLRHSLTTPSIKRIELSGILRELRFEEVMMGWGCFFFHELDLRKIYIPAVPEKDSTALIKEYKTPFQAKSSRGKEPAPSKLVSHHRSTTLYPWGEIVSESRLIELINTVPQQFLRDPMHLSNDSLLHPDSSLIFMSFTNEIWLLLANQFSIAGVDVPTNLEDAMDIWSLKSIQRICNEVIIHPTHDLLKKVGPVKKKNEEVFGGKQRIFFPRLIDLDASPLKPLTMHETCYLSRYHYVLNNQSPEEIENLDADLEHIFSRLQCLPAAINERGRHTIWKTESGKVKFLINSLYYRIKGVSIEREACVRRRAQLTGPAFQKRVHETIYGNKSYRKRKRREEKQTRRLRPRKKLSSNGWSKLENGDSKSSAGEESDGSQEEKQTRRLRPRKKCSSIATSLQDSESSALAGEEVDASDGSST